MTVLVAGLLAGCSASPRAGPIGQDPAGVSVVRVMADWDDVNAAAVVAAAKTETVVVGVVAPGADDLVFEVRSVRDEAVRVTARRLGPPEAPGGAVPIELTCLFGSLGDSGQQGRFLNAMETRLVDLRGVDYRKVR